MSNAKHIAHAALGAISIFAIGVVVGLLLDRAFLNPTELAADVPAEMALDATHESFFQDMRADLGFTEMQARQVQQIFAKHQAAVNDAWSAVHTRLNAAIDSVTAEIEAVLEPDQREKLHEWLMERHGLRDAHGVGESH